MSATEIDTTSTGNAADRAAMALVRGHGLDVDEVLGVCAACSYLTTAYLFGRRRVDADRFVAENGSAIHLGCGGRLKLFRAHRGNA